MRQSSGPGGPHGLRTTLVVASLVLVFTCNASVSRANMPARDELCDVPSSGCVVCGPEPRSEEAQCRIRAMHDGVAECDTLDGCKRCFATPEKERKYKQCQDEALARGLTSVCADRRDDMLWHYYCPAGVTIKTHLSPLPFPYGCGCRWAQEGPAPQLSVIVLAALTALLYNRRRHRERG
jgi:hypothetical protein